MQLDAPVEQVIHKQATIGDIIQRYIHGRNAYEIAEEFGLEAEKVKEIILHANAAGQFRPAGQPDELDVPEEAPEAPQAPAPEVAPVAPAPAPAVEAPAPVVEAPAPAPEAPAPVVEQPASAPAEAPAAPVQDAPGPATTESNV